MAGSCGKAGRARLGFYVPPSAVRSRLSCRSSLKSMIGTWSWVLSLLPIPLLVYGTECKIVPSAFDVPGWRTYVRLTVDSVLWCGVALVGTNVVAVVITAGNN